MQTSKLNNIFDEELVTEESKTLSPLTYYHPFQSSFDPNFGKFSQRKANIDHMSKTRNDQSIGGKVSAETGLKFMNGKNSSTTFYRNQQQGLRIPKNENYDGALSLWNSSKERLFFKEAIPSTALSSQSQGSPSWVYPGFLWADPKRFPSVEKNRIPKTPANPNVNFLNSRQQTFMLNKCSVTPYRPFEPSAMPSYRQVPNYNMSNKNNSSSELFTNSSTKNKSPNFKKTGTHKRPMVCNFCKNNKEVPAIYLNHYLHDPETKILTCPVLRKHVCGICGETGDRAHTLQYCPVNRQRGFQAKVPVLLKTRTVTNSTGKIRRN